MLQVGDEKSFVAYEETMIYTFQKFFSSQQGMEGVAVISTCALIEDEVYQETLKTFHLPTSGSVWASVDCINHFVARCEHLLRKLDTKKNTNWRKIFEDYAKNGAQMVKIIEQDESEVKLSKPKAPKAPSAPKPEKVNAPKPPPKAPKAPPKPKKPAAPKKPTKGPGDEATVPAPLATISGAALDLPFAPGADPVEMDVGDDEWGFDFSNEDNPDIKVQTDDAAWGI